MSQMSEYAATIGLYTARVDAFKLVAEQFSRTTDALAYALLAGANLPEPPETPEGLDEAGYRAHCALYDLMLPEDFDELAEFSLSFTRLNDYWGSYKGRQVQRARPRR